MVVVLLLVVVEVAAVVTVVIEATVTAAAEVVWKQAIEPTSHLCSRIDPGPKKNHAIKEYYVK